MGGNTDNGSTGRDVADYGGSGGDGWPLPYPDTADYRCSRSYPDTFAYVDISAEGLVKWEKVGYIRNDSGRRDRWERRSVCSLSLHIFG